MKSFFTIFLFVIISIVLCDENEPTTTTLKTMPLLQIQIEEYWKNAKNPLTCKGQKLVFARAAHDLILGNDDDYIRSMEKELDKLKESCHYRGAK